MNDVRIISYLNYLVYSQHIILDVDLLGEIEKVLIISPRKSLMLNPQRRWSRIGATSNILTKTGEMSSSDVASTCNLCKTV